MPHPGAQAQRPWGPAVHPEGTRLVLHRAAPQRRGACELLVEEKQDGAFQDPLKWNKKISNCIKKQNETNPPSPVAEAGPEDPAEDRGAGARGTRACAPPSFLPHTSFPARSCHLDGSLKI